MNEKGYICQTQAVGCVWLSAGLEDELKWICGWRFDWISQSDGVMERCDWLFKSVY